MKSGIFSIFLFDVADRDYARMANAENNKKNKFVFKLEKRLLHSSTFTMVANTDDPRQQLFAE